MKNFVRVLMIIAACLAVASCSKTSQVGGGASGGFKSPDPIYAGYDLSQPLTLYVYMVGDTPAALEEVIAKANAEYFKPILNTTIELAFVSWGDLTTKYALVLAGGEDVDIVFTAPWNYYEQESSKGSFVEITEEFRNKWLPATSKELPLVAWLQMLTKGKVFAVPQNISSADGYKYVVIRDDIRTKNSLPEPNDWKSMENYLFTVADKEPSLQGYAAASSTSEVFYVFRQVNDIQLGDYDFAWDGTGKREPRPEELTYVYMTDGYLNYALEMSRWADRGVWSKNVLNNTIAATDTFIQGKNASVFWNASVFNAGKGMEKNSVGKAGYYDLTPDKPVRLAGYANNAFAIAASSKYPERAALTLDLMKSNPALNEVLNGGIEGKHYINNGDGTYTPGPQAADYTFNCWAWGLGRPDRLEALDPEAPAVQQKIFDSMELRQWEPLIDGFRFDSTPIMSEWAVISALVEEYGNSFGCGAFGNQTRAKIDEFRAKLKTAGIDKVTQEYRNQYSAFVAKYGN
ncbi:ABC transporter substrate-binding protein [Spirochaetia bacterium]|nr:ABC transporter substrate-binding protein [Spirochaetia bacterium]